MSSDDARGPAPVSAFRLLAVDDDEAVLRVFAKVLAAPPASGPAPARTYELTLCRNAAEGVAAAQAAAATARPFAVALLDLNMPPGPDGLWTAERLRELDPFLNIIIVTAFTDIDPEEIARRVPPADKLLYLRKPVHPAEVRQFAGALCSKWELERLRRADTRALEDTVARRTAELAEANRRLREELAERQRVEAALRRSEENYRQFFDDDPTADFSADGGGHLLSANLAFRRLFGCRDDQPLAAELDELFHSRDERTRFWQHLRAAGRLEDFALHLQRRDGAEVFVIANVRAVQAAAGGELLGLRGYLLDVTHRRQLEARLHQAQVRSPLGYGMRGSYVLISAPRSPRP